VPPNTKATTAVVNPDDDDATTNTGRHPLDHSRQMGAANIADR